MFHHVPSNEMESKSDILNESETQDILAVVKMIGPFVIRIRMSWFDASNFANLAKNALKEAQKTIDKALDISEDDEEDQDSTSRTDDTTDANSQTDSKSPTNNTLWDSFGISFFEKPKADDPGQSVASVSGESSCDIVVTKEPVSQTSNFDLMVAVKDSSLLPLNVNDKEDTRSNENIAKDSSVVVRRPEKRLNNGNRLSIVSNESDRKSTVSSDSIEALGSTATTTPDSESSSKARNSNSNESSVEVLSTCSIEVLNSHEDPNRLPSDSTSSESIEIIPEIEEDEDDKSFGGGADDSCTSASESTMTVLELGHRSSIKDMLKSSSSMDTSLTEVLSPWEHGVNRVISELPEIVSSDSPLESMESAIDAKLPLKRARNELSGTSITTLDSSSCDEGTMIGSSSDEAPKECTSSVSSLKSLLADAIIDQPDDWVTIRESSPTTSSMESRPENVKIGSSGHTSADELETATSSDVEIISSPNGESSNANSRQSPAKLIYKNSKGKMSVVLSSDVLIPEIIGRSLSFKMKGHNREPSETSSGGSDDNIELDRLLKKIAELNEILEARESKLLEMSMKNAELSETNSNLKSQLECQMNEEFTQRLAALEKKFQQAIREKETLRKQLENYKLLKETSENEEDKDQIIKELREEGEKLSKQQLSSNVLIKKLRNTEKDHLKLISSLREQHDGLMQEVERAKKSLNAKEELERLQIEAVHNLTKNNQKLEKQSANLQSQIDNLTSTLISLQKEIEEKKMKISNLEDRLREETTAATQEAIEKADANLRAERDRREKAEIALANLQKNLHMMEMQHSEHEASLRKENQKLMNTLEEYKQKNEKLSEEMLDTTRPIVKQLEEEITKRNAAVAFWEKQERELSVTIHELQDQLKTVGENAERAEERFKLNREELNELEAKLKHYQTQLENQESQVKFQLKVNDLLREQNEKSMADKNAEIQEMKLQLEELKKQRAEESSLEKPRNINEIYKDRSKLRLLLQGDALAGHDSDSDVDMASLSPSPHLSDGSNTWLGPSDEDPGMSSSQKGSIYDGCSRPIATATSTIENLQTQYKLKEGEVQQLQWEIKRHDHERIILTNEITLLASKVEELEKQLTALNELQTRYDALLQMYGEKMEECQELRLDLEDVKEMYKIQIDELLTRSRTG